MININCSKCGKLMEFDSSTGLFKCTECNISIPVTDLDYPQLGSKSKSQYIPEKAAKNISQKKQNNEKNDNNATATNSNNNIATDNILTIPNRYSREDVLKAYSGWSKHGLFSPGAYSNKNALKNLTLKYVPAFVYSVTGHGSIELTCNRINETVNSKERRVTTDYYGIRREIDTVYNPYAVFSDKVSPGSYIMNFINDYSYEDINYNNMNSNEINTNETNNNTKVSAKKSDNTHSSDMEDYTSYFDNNNTDLYKIPDDVTRTIIEETTSELQKSVTGYSSTYVENTEADYTINSSTPVLVPVWVNIHENEQSENNFYMNGQTGTIYGRPRISRLKVGCIAALLNVILSLIASFTAYSIASAEIDYNYTINSIEPLLDDTADLLSDYEEVALLDTASRQKDITGFQYIFATVDSTTYNDKEYELQRIYALLKESITAPGTVLFLIGTDGTKLECALQGYKAAKEYLPRETCNDIEIKLQNNADVSDPNKTFNDLFDILGEVNDGTYKIDSSADDVSKTNMVPIIILIVLLCTVTSSLFTVLIIRSKKSSIKTKLVYTAVLTDRQDIYLRTNETVYKLK